MFLLIFLALIFFFPPFSPLKDSSIATVACLMLSLSLVTVLFRLLMDLSAFDCWRLRLVNLGFREAGSHAALRLAAHWSCEATDGRATAGVGEG